jgi:hypothetical protein
MRNVNVKLDTTGIKVKSFITTDEKTIAVRATQKNGGYTWVG